MLKTTLLMIKFISHCDAKMGMECAQSLSPTKTQSWWIVVISLKILHEVEYLNLICFWSVSYTAKSTNITFYKINSRLIVLLLNYHLQYLEFWLNYKLYYKFFNSTYSKEYLSTLIWHRKKIFHFFFNQNADKDYFNDIPRILFSLYLGDTFLMEIFSYIASAFRCQVAYGQ